MYRNSVILFVHVILISNDTITQSFSTDDTVCLERYQLLINRKPKKALEFRKYDNPRQPLNQPGVKIAVDMISQSTQIC